MRLRPRLRSILLSVNLLILALPLGGITVLRIYESALVRQTETELIAQGAFIAATYRALLRRISTESGYGFEDPKAYGVPMPRDLIGWGDEREQWRPRPAALDLAVDIIRPPQPDPIRAPQRYRSPGRHGRPRTDAYTARRPGHNPGRDTRN